eukprot:3346010-Amphidinium_carterae.6
MAVLTTSSRTLCTSSPSKVALERVLSFPQLPMTRVEFTNYARISCRQLPIAQHVLNKALPKNSSSMRAKACASPFPEVKCKEKLMNMSAVACPGLLSLPRA